MNVLIINLPPSTDRLAFQKKQLKRLGIAFNVLKATSILDISQFDIQNLSLGWERPLRAVELACFLSHKKAWQYVVDKNKPILILEDDALLSMHAKELLLELDKQMHLDLVTLEVRGRKKIVSKKEVVLNDSKHKLFELYQDRTGAAGYVLWPSGANKLLKKTLSKPPGLADAFISSCYSLSAYQVEPAALIQLDQCENYNIFNSHKTSSSISSQKKPTNRKCDLLEYFIFKYRRIHSQFKMGLRHMSVIWSSHRRNISIEPDYF